MDWFRAVNSYCERTDAAYWSEPLNAVSNAAFLVTALICWHRFGGRAERSLAAILGVIGLGSYLFHTHAQVWAALADVLPILGFILLYIHLATVRYLALPLWAGIAAAAAYGPASAAVSAVLATLFGPLNGSVSYFPVVLLIAAYALLLARRAPAAARGLGVGAALLCLSLAFRTVDEALCPVWPLGTHFLWHLLNAVMLGWMIAVLAAHPRAPALARAAPPE